MYGGDGGGDVDVGGCSACGVGGAVDGGGGGGGAVSVVGPIPSTINFWILPFI